MLNSFIWPIDRTLSSATTQGQSRPGSDGNEGVLCITQSSNITGASPLYYLMSYSGYSLGSLTPLWSCSLYSTAPADWAKGQSGTGSNANEGVLHNPQSFGITGASVSDCLMSYQDTHWEGSYASAVIQCILQPQTAGLTVKEEVVDQSTLIR